MAALSSSVREQLIPLHKDNWDDLVVSEEEELYQEHWGEYESWWYAVPFEHDVVDAPVVFRYEEIMGMVMQLVDEDANSEPANNSVQILDGGFQVDVCKSCHCIVDNGRHVGTWDSEIPEHQPAFKCMFCGPPLPDVNQNVRPVSVRPIMFQRWNDCRSVNMGELNGELIILHATYGGPSCPDRDVTDKVRRLVEFQRVNLGYCGFIRIPRGIHEWIGDPEHGTAKTFRVWFVVRTPEEISALAVLQQFAIGWREKYYAPGGLFEAQASERFEHAARQ